VYVIPILVRLKGAYSTQIFNDSLNSREKRDGGCGGNSRDVCPAGNAPRVPLYNLESMDRGTLSVSSTKTV
jgi:hypothetical protein